MSHRLVLTAMELVTHPSDDPLPFDASTPYRLVATELPSTDSVRANDSASANDHRGADAAVDYPATSFPLHTGASLQDFLVRLAMASANVSAPSLAMVSEPNLYTLIAAVFRFGRNSGADLEAALGSAGFIPDGPDSGTGRAWATLLSDLRAELRWRNCQSMGKNPTGPVRRGRLLQLVGSFTTLARYSASPLHLHRRSADCPLCHAPATFCVFLASVQWRCFACDGCGGLPEFADQLLDTLMTNGSRASSDPG